VEGVFGNGRAPAVRCSAAGPKAIQSFSAVTCDGKAVDGRRCDITRDQIFTRRFVEKRSHGRPNIRSCRGRKFRSSECTMSSRL
jgi:hypothetical protein